MRYQIVWNPLVGIRLGRGAWIAVAVLLAVLFGPLAQHVLGSDAEEVEIALSLARLLQAGRTVISSNQALINDPERGDKGLTGDVVLAATTENYRKVDRAGPASIDPASREGRLLQAEMAAIKEVIDENQSLINEKGIRLQGIHPGDLRTAGDRAAAGEDRDEVARSRSRRRPRSCAIGNPGPTTGKNRYRKQVPGARLAPRPVLLRRSQPESGREAFRVMVPEYYANSCLSCHGPRRARSTSPAIRRKAPARATSAASSASRLFRPADDGRPNARLPLDHGNVPPLHLRPPGAALVDRFC